MSCPHQQFFLHARMSRFTHSMFDFQGFCVNSNFLNLLLFYYQISSDTILMQHLSSTAAYSLINVNNDSLNVVKLTIQKLASQSSNSLNIINLTTKNRIPFSPIMFLLLCTP